MAQNMNQFSQGTVKGQVMGVPNPATLSAQIKSGGTTVYPGYAVKLVDGTANTILVDAAAATDDIFGFVIWNPKKSSFAALDALEVALPGTVIILEAAASVARGQSAEYVATGGKVTSYGGTNTPIGVFLDKATAAGQLVRVLIRVEAEYSSSSSSSSCRSSSSSSSRSV